MVKCYINEGILNFITPFYHEKKKVLLEVNYFFEKF